MCMQYMCSMGTLGLRGVGFHTGPVEAQVLNELRAKNRFLIASKCLPFC